MGTLTPFSYRTGNFLLFKMDVRCKIICICFLTIVAVNADYLHLCLISAVLSWLLYRCNFNILRFLKEIKYFLLLLIFVFIVRGFTTPGVPLYIPIFEFMDKFKLMGKDIVDIITYININILPYSHITKEGFIDGGKVAWRFFIIIIMGILFSSSTTSSSLKDSVMWFLKPIPFVPEKRAGVMVSLFVRFLPLILEKTLEVSDAQKSRCAHLQKNPVKKIKNLTVPLLIKVFDSADKLAVAMASRCYNDNRTEITENTFLRSGYENQFYAGTAALALIILFL
ncbi:MAG: energy-coupling factor transporter transmembrane protein EcfT [Desulfamplus sp.]|nr:energy-coupling factor transporter transmembrane protein EcfT [Desulfamplus sp.]MBF0411922.1 energy-coupling factor transporter transmembrane protein EcfT [Desulfamplus sp.]